MPSYRIITSGVLCALLATGATACGTTKGTGAQAVPASSAPVSASPSPSPSANLDSMTAAEVESAAQKAMAGLKSLRVAGTMTSDNQKITLDLSADKAKNCVGTVTIADMGSLEIRHTAAGTWIKPDQAFWKSVAAQQGKPQAGAMAAEIFKGRYLTGGPDDADMKEMTSMCDIIEGIANDDSAPTDATKVGTQTINGIKALGVKDTSDGTTSTGYVAEEGKPYLLRLVKEGAEGGQLDLSDFDKPLDIQAPPADQVIDMSMFKKKLNSV
jgi:hypothetical protein